MGALHAYLNTQAQSVILPSWLISIRDPDSNVIPNLEIVQSLFVAGNVTVDKSELENKFLRHGYKYGRISRSDYFWLKASETRAGARYTWTRNVGLSKLFFRH